MTDAEARERAEAITDIMASWALEGMYPTPDDLADMEAYIAGTLTLEDIRTKTLTAVTSAQDPATADHRRETLHRMRAHRERQNPPPRASPHEIILAATVDRSSRDDLVAALCAYPYTFSRMVDDGTDAVIPGSWNQIGAAHLGGLLSDDEYRQIVARVQPPPYT